MQSGNDTAINSHMKGFAAGLAEASPLVGQAPNPDDIGLCGLRDVDHPSLALQPEAPNRTDDEPFESADGLAFGLALRDASIEILPCLFRVVSLGQSDPIDESHPPAPAPAAVASEAWAQFSPRIRRVAAVAAAVVQTTPASCRPAYLLGGATVAIMSLAAVGMIASFVLG